IVSAVADDGPPVISYGRDYNGSAITPYTEYPGLEQPVTYWVPSIAPSSVVVYRGAAFPAWDGDVMVSTLGSRYGRHIRRVDMENGAPVGQQKLFTELNQRLRHIVVGPDGEIYLLAEGTNKVEGIINTDGLIYRITPN
ncbi:MAG: PQQ-dependent sugar dehydrogenase, partial [Pseudomonadota bacterium]